MNADNQIYKQVGEEVFKAEYSAGPMARAVAEAAGDRVAIQSLYIRYRYEELKQQLEKEKQASIEYECSRTESQKQTDRLNGLFTCPICEYYGQPKLKTYRTGILSRILTRSRCTNSYYCPVCAYPLDESEIPEIDPSRSASNNHSD